MSRMINRIIVSGILVFYGMIGLISPIVQAGDHGLDQLMLLLLDDDITISDVHNATTHSTTDQEGPQINQTVISHVQPTVSQPTPIVPDSVSNVSNDPGDKYYYQSHYQQNNQQTQQTHFTLTEELILKEEYISASMEDQYFNKPKAVVIMSQGTSVSTATETITELEKDHLFVRPYQEHHQSMQDDLYNFHFGVYGQHLMFSEPVRLDIPVDDAIDGEEVMVHVLHYGDQKYTTHGLTTQPELGCDPQGNAYGELSPLIVDHGYVTVYTCGASDFTVTYVGGVTTDNYVDNATLTKTIAVDQSDIVGQNQVESLTIEIDFWSIDGTDLNNPGIDQSYSSEISMSLTSPSGTTVQLLDIDMYDDTAASRVQVTFDDTATASPSATPTTGTFLSIDNLSSFVGEDPLGDWIFALVDDTADDGVILYEVNLMIETPDIETITNISLYCGNGVIDTPGYVTTTLRSEGFESIAGTVATAGLVYDGVDYDIFYENSGTPSRLRYGTDAVNINTGTGALTMDVSTSGTQVVNYLIFESDLSDYADDQIAVSFDYAHHGEESHDNDRVWVRGSNTDTWIELYDWDANKLGAGSYNSVVDLDFSTVLSDAGQVVTETFQLRFGQEDNYIANSNTATDGLSIDNVSLSSLQATGPTVAEECDDGNTTDGDSCTSVCTINYCGNGVIDQEGSIQEIINEGFETWGDATIDVNTTLYTSAGYNVFYETSATPGRVRYGADTILSNTGTGALTMDVSTNNNLRTNYTIFETDMSDFVGSDDVLLSFDYVHHGEEQHGNDLVWVRGSNIDSWVQLYDWYTNRESAGTYKSVIDLDVDTIIDAASQSLSSTFQIRFGQEDNYTANSTTATDGLTIDNIFLQGTNIGPETTEECDDGNTINGDGCSATCTVESISGDVSISSIATILFPSMVNDNIIQSVLQSTTASFSLLDTLGDDAGWYTTLQASDLISNTGDTIAADNIAISHPGAITVVSGTANPLIEISPSVSTGFVSLDTPITYLLRNTATNSGVTGEYTTNPDLQITIPAYQSVGDYTSTITYTLYEN